MKKLYFFYLIIIGIGIILICKLFYLQIYSNKYIYQGINSSIRKNIIIPNRGYIYDRNKNLLVFNKSFYEITVIPKEIESSFDIEKFIKLINIDKDTFFKKLKKAELYSKYLPSTFLKYFSKDDFLKIQEKIYKYKGFEWVEHYLRDYKVNSSAKLFGYISEISKNQLKKEPNYYRFGDFVGVSGIEKSYEKILRGEKGVKYMLTDNKGRIIESYNQGKEDKKAKNGSDIYLTIDWSLQEYSEKLMFKKKGSIIAIDPNTGEILVLVSSPIVDPHIFTEKENFKKISNLYKDTINKPLFNRAIDGVYPPGSPFKILTELAALQMKSVNNSTNFFCKNNFIYNTYNDKKIKCHGNVYNHFKNLETAIAVSCNSFFAQTYMSTIGKNKNFSKRNLDKWSEIIKSFGLGILLKNDLSKGKKGYIPNGDYYDKQYGIKKWNASNTISNSIGQGEILITPLQLANITAIIANKGFFYTPHIVKSIGSFLKKNNLYTKPQYTKVDKKYFEPIIRGMEKSFNIKKGTSFKYRIKSIRIAGKTGTSQNFIKINNKIISLPDHSIFIAFAPIENPKIVIATIIENGNWGSRWAGPITSLIIEKYIKKTIEKKKLENYIMNNGLQKSYDYINNLIKFEKSKKNSIKKY